MMEKMKMLKVIDTSLKLGDPASSKFISSDQYKLLYPGGIIRSVDVLFLPGVAQLMPEKEAIQFIKNYPDILKLVGEKNVVLQNKDDLDGLKRKDIMVIAETYSIDEYYAFKTDVLVMMIREERASGKIPMTELELKI